MVLLTYKQLAEFIEKSTRYYRRKCYTPKFLGRGFPMHTKIESTVYLLYHFHHYDSTSKSIIHSFIQLIKISLLSKLRTSPCVNCIRNSRMNEACNISSEYFRTYKCRDHLDKLSHITFTVTLQNKPIIPSAIVNIWKFYGG